MTKPIGQPLQTKEELDKLFKAAIKNYTKVLNDKSFAILAIHANETGMYQMTHDYKNISKLTVLGFLESMAAKIRVELVGSYQQSEMNTMQANEPIEKQDYVG